MRKYIALFMDAKDNPIKADGPFYGELTDEKVEMLIKKAKRMKAKYIQIERRTEDVLLRHSESSSILEK